MIEAVSIVKQSIRTLTVSSAAFPEGGYIPPEYTCDGKNINPPIEIGNIPKGTKSLAVIVDDPDAPVRTWIHWVLWNVPPTKKIKEGNVSGIEGLNDFGQFCYRGPCPPSGTHHYHFKVYALDDFLYLNQNATKYHLEKMMGTHIIGFGELVGVYKRTSNFRDQ